MPSTTHNSSFASIPTFTMSSLDEIAVPPAPGLAARSALPLDTLQPAGMTARGGAGEDGMARLLAESRLPCMPAGADGGLGSFVLDAARPAAPAEPSPAADGAAASRGWLASLSAFGSKLKELCSVRATWRQLQAVVGEVREAGRDPAAQFNRALAESEEAAVQVVNRRLFAALAASEIVGTYICSPLVCSAWQYLTGNAYNGVIGTVVGDYFPAVATFAAAWIYMNRDRYAEGRDLTRCLTAGAMRYLREALPTHAACLVASGPAYAVGSAVASGCIWMLNTAVGAVAHYLPAFAVTQPLNMLVGEAIFIGSVAWALKSRLGPSLARRLIAEHADSAQSDRRGAADK